MLYTPAGTWSDPIVKSTGVVSVVAASAPVRQTFPYASCPPKILRPRTDGALYSIRTFEPPKSASVFVIGLLSLGSDFMRPCAITNPASARLDRAADAINFLVNVIFLSPG